MAALDPRINDYIDKAADFAKPILNHLRSLVHQACPQVVESWKWSFPHFLYRDRTLCSMAAFKQHASFGFWLGSLMKDSKKLLETGSDKTSMGHLGQIKSLKDLPSDKVLLEYIKEAMLLTEQGAKIKKAKPVATTLVVPDYFLAALKKNKTAAATFDAFSQSHKKEYVEWITEAKTEATREKRMEQALQMLSEGKSRNWKYAAK